jgi:glutathione S-transferase
MISNIPNPSDVNHSGPLAMKLFYSPASPYVRKCLVVAHELGLSDQIEHLAAAAHPINRDLTIVAANPLGKLPALITDDGQALYDSRVICEYLNDLGKGNLQPSGAKRWAVLTEQALGDGILDAALLARYEGFMRPEPLRWADWSKGQMAKIHSGIETIENQCGQWGDAIDIGKITLACALGYLDFRFASLEWRTQYPNTAAWHLKFNARASMQATMPKA